MQDSVNTVLYIVTYYFCYNCQSSKITLYLYSSSYISHIKCCDLGIRLYSLYEDYVTDFYLVSMGSWSKKYDQFFVFDETITSAGTSK